jgi:hypothetical protein
MHSGELIAGHPAGSKVMLASGEASPFGTSRSIGLGLLSLCKAGPVEGAQTGPITPYDIPILAAAAAEEGVPFLQISKPY